jgi:hypothetical protein
MMEKAKITRIVRFSHTRSSSRDRYRSVGRIMQRARPRVLLSQKKLRSGPYTRSPPPVLSTHRPPLSPCRPRLTALTT